VPEPFPLPSSRLRLRRLSPADLSAFQAYRGDPSVGRYQGWLPLADQAALAFLAQMAKTPLFPIGDWVQIGIADPHSNDLIGDLGYCLAAPDASAELGITLGARHQGRGLGAEAYRLAINLIFQNMPAAQVCGTADERNHACIRMLARVGMRRREIKRAVFKGESCLESTYVITRQEYDQG